jgi:hypothetical protein
LTELRHGVLEGLFRYTERVLGGVREVAHQGINFFLVEVAFVVEPQLQQRDIDAIVLPSWGRIVPVDGVVPFEMVDDAGAPVGPVRFFLRDFAARGSRIATNLEERIGEVTDNGWLGEIQGLRVSLEAARSKLARLNRATATNRPVNLGLPVLRDLD